MGREMRTDTRLYPGTRDSRRKRCIGRDRVKKRVYHPIPRRPKSWAKEESVMSAGSTTICQELGRAKPYISWVYILDPEKVSGPVHQLDHYQNLIFLDFPSIHH